MSRRFWTALPLVAGLACGGAAGTRPHDMSTAQHEQRAREHDAVADRHASAHDPTARESVLDCRRPGTPAGPGFALGRVCWSSVVNPTAEHARAAQEHREIAAAHRRASSALAQAEASACVGLSDEDRDMSPFLHTEDIASVDRLIERERDQGPNLSKSGIAWVDRFRGARVVFRAVPGLTAEWLQRVVDCHLARNASLGHDVPSMPDCPLVPGGASARVVSTGNGFAVEIRSEDADVADEILARARRLIAAPARLQP